MSKIIKPAVVLFLVAAIAAALLGYVSSITAEPIAKAEQQAKAENMDKVLECDEWGEAVEVEDSIITDYSEGKKDGKTVGYAFSVETKGYSTGLKIMVGVDTEGTVTGISIVDCSNETPGLGANAAKPDFYEQFAGKSGELKVNKDGGEINAITGATLTSRGVTNGVNEVTKYFEDNLKGGKN